MLFYTYLFGKKCTFVSVIYTTSSFLIIRSRNVFIAESQWTFVAVKMRNASKSFEIESHNNVVKIFKFASCANRIPYILPLKLYVNKFIRTFVNRTKRSEAFMNVLKSRREFMSLGKFSRSAEVYGVTLSVIFRGCDCSRVAEPERDITWKLTKSNFRCACSPGRSSREIGFSDLSDAHAQKNSTEPMIARTPDDSGRAISIFTLFPTRERQYCVANGAVKAGKASFERVLSILTVR